MNTQPESKSPDEYVMASTFARESGFRQRAFALMLRERPDIAPPVIRRHTRVYAKRGEFQEFLRRMAEPYGDNIANSTPTATATATAKK